MDPDFNEKLYKYVSGSAISVQLPLETLQILCLGLMISECQDTAAYSYMQHNFRMDRYKVKGTGTYPIELCSLYFIHLIPTHFHNLVAFLIWIPCNVKS